MGRPIDRYNALAPMLGMETLQAPIENLRQARLSAERERTEAEEHVSQVTGLLRGSPDERASTAMEALSGAWDLDKIEALVTGTDSAVAEREGLLAALEQRTLCRNRYVAGPRMNFARSVRSIS